MEKHQNSNIRFLLYENSAILAIQQNNQLTLIQHVSIFSIMQVTSLTQSKYRFSSLTHFCQEKLRSNSLHLSLWKISLHVKNIQGIKNVALMSKYRFRASRYLEICNAINEVSSLYHTVWLARQIRDFDIFSSLRAF